jgi:hypothetical protein
MKRTILKLALFAFAGVCFIPASMIGADNAAGTNKQSGAFPATKSQRQETPAWQEENTERWEIVQAGLWFGYPKSTIDSNVYGLKLGLPCVGGNGKVQGLEFSLIGSGTDHVKGFQTAIGTNLCQDFSGLQLSIYNYAAKSANGFQIGLGNLAGRKGVQLGIVNVSKKAPFQLGLLNFNKDGWLPFMVLFNF